MYRYKVICPETQYVYAETMARDIAENVVQYIFEALGIETIVEIY